MLHLAKHLAILRRQTAQHVPKDVDGLAGAGVCCEHLLGGAVDVRDCVDLGVVA